MRQYDNKVLALINKKTMTDDPNRKDFRREKITKKKFLDKKKDYLQDPDQILKKNNQLKQKKQEIDEEEWEDWDRYYNR
jgi:hypothetical protein